ncbi:MAG: alpha/beta fold hydrolase [Flavobacteriaceae bacterium]
MNYLIREPRIKKDKNPLLLLLHGYGSNEEDLFSFASELPDEYYVISVQAPYSLQPYGYAWYAINFDADMNKFSDNEQAVQSRELIVHFLDGIIEKYPIDKNDITLIGFSQGSILSYAVALSYPEKINRVVALSGYLNENILKENYQNNDFSKLNFFVSHGSADQIIPVEWARKTPDILSRLGVKNVYFEYPVGHGVAPKNFLDLKKWILNN